MKNFARRLLALGITASILMASFTACSSSGRDKVDSDAPWYELTKITIGGEIDYDLFEYQYSQLAGIAGDYLVYYTDGYYVTPDDFNYETDSFFDYQYEVIDIYDFEGNKTASVDIMEAYRDAGLGENGYIQNVEKVGDDFVVNAITYSEDWMEQTSYQAVLDLDTMELSAFAELDDESPVAEILNSEDASFERTFNVGDYSIKSFWLYGETSSYILLLENGDETIKLDLREEFPGEDIYDISTLIDIGDGKGIIFASTGGFAGMNYYLLDTNDMSVEEYDEDLDWLTNSYYNMVSVENYGTVFVNQEGISSIDFENQALETILDFNNTNANRYDVDSCTPISITDDRILLQGYDYTPALGNNGVQSCIYVFDRADSNPHAGKTILTVASLDYYNYSVCEAICQFNETSEDYYLEIDTRYNIEKFYDNDEEDYNLAAENANIALGNQLSIDLMAGDGPDIIIDGASYSQLNNDDYLLDLTDYVSGLSGIDLFTNIIDASRTGDALYQLPITFAVEGISTDASNVRPNQIGFTYEEFAQFVDEVCNGTNPISARGQIDTFITGLSLMPDLMMEDGRVNYNNDAFVALAEYVRDYIDEEIEVDFDVDYEYGFGAYEEEAASRFYIVDMNSFIRTFIDTTSDKVLLGLPTYDARGPVAVEYNSVAVAANLSSEETAACLDYVSLLLGDDAQFMLGIEAGIPINRNAFVSVGEAYIDNHNHELETWYRDWTEEDFRENGMNPDPVDYSKIEAFEALVSGTTTWVTTDGAVNAIIREEIPAFFEGDKTLDQIISVLENRVQTLIDERG